MDLTLYGYSKKLILLYQFYSMNLSIKHLIVISVFICVVRPYSGWSQTGYVFSDYITDYLRCLANVRLMPCSFSGCL